MRGRKTHAQAWLDFYSRDVGTWGAAEALLRLRPDLRDPFLAAAEGV